MTYVKESKVSGIPAYRFEIPREAWSAPKPDDPEFSCYCAPRRGVGKNTDKKSEYNKWCQYTGLMDAGPCQKDAPLLLSAPHFYNADPIFRTLIDGLNPVKEKHECIVDIEKVDRVQLYCDEIILFILQF